MQYKCSISVIMCVYNTDKQFLKESIESVLNQTFDDFEFIIIVDAPTDGSLEIVNEYKQKDKRIITIENPCNYGLTKSLNIGISIAKGKYIARMDSDDVSFPNRFFEQYNYMETHPDTVVLGSRTITYGSLKTTQDICVPDQEVLRIRMMFCNPGVPHPTAFIRKEIIDKYEINYTESIKKSQDYKLWVDLIEYGKLEMLPKILLMYRVHDNQISAGDPHRKNTYSLQISAEVTSRLIDKISEEEIEIIRTLRTGELPRDNIHNLELFFDKITNYNYLKKIYNSKKLNRELRYIWTIKALRRIRNYRKFDLLFNKWFSIFYPNVFCYFIFNQLFRYDYKKKVMIYNKKVGKIIK